MTTKFYQFQYQRYLVDQILGSETREIPDEKDEEDDVGEGGGEVDHLAARLDPLEEAQEVDQPGDAEAEEHPPARLAHL